MASSDAARRSRGATAAIPLRLARREARRHPWRSLLVMILVAVPVAGMIVGTTLLRTDHRSPLEEWDATWGTADVTVYGPTSAVPQAEHLLDRQPGVRSTTFAESYGGFRTSDAAARGPIHSLDLGSPIWAGRFDVQAGRAPATVREIALSTTLARRFHVGPGDDLVLERPDITLAVTGVVEDRECIRCDAIFGPAGVDTPLVTAFGGSYEQTLVDLGTPTPDELRPLIFWSNAQVRPVPELAPFYGSDDPGSSVAWTVVIGALAVAVVGIVIAAAFAAGARGQLTTLGLLSASGAPQSVLRRTLVLQGTITGAVGTLLGFGVAGAALVLGAPLAETFFNRRVDGYEFGVAELVAISVIGLLGATGAALVPSRTVARTPTLLALAGRRPVERVALSFTLRGAFAMAGGFGLLLVAAAGANGGTNGTLFAAVAIIGGCALLFGAAALTPAMVQRLEPLAGRTRGAARLAGRGLARNRTRSGAIVAAVAAAGALAVGGTSLARVVTQDSGDYLRLSPDVVQVVSSQYQGDDVPPDPIDPDIIDSIAGVLSDPEVFVPDRVQAQSTVEGVDYLYGSSSAVVVTDDLARALDLSPETRRALADDGAVLLSYDAAREQRVVIAFDRGPRVEAELIFSPFGTTDAEGLLIGPELGVRLVDAGATVLAGRAAYIADRDGIDDIERFDLDDLASGQFSTDQDPGVTGVSIAYGYERLDLDPSLIEFGLAALSVVFALLVVAIGLGLAAADDRSERQQLVVAGAGPTTLARVSGLQAAVLAAFGFVLAVPVGYLPVLAVVGVVNVGSEVAFPLETVAVLLVLVPVLAYLGARMVTAVTQRVRPVRLSTATFE